MEVKRRLIMMSPWERARLEEWVKSEATPRRVVFRSKICLLAAEGMSNSQIAKDLDTSRASVRLWKKRFQEGGPEALINRAPRGPSPRRIDDELRAQILRALECPTEKAPFRWTTRSLAKALGVSNATISRVWRSRAIEESKQDLRLEARTRSFTEAASELVGIYAAQCVLLVVIRNGCKDGGSQQVTNGGAVTSQDNRSIGSAFGEHRGARSHALEESEAVEKIRYSPREAEDIPWHLRDFLDTFAKKSSGDCQYNILLFEPEPGIQWLVESMVKTCERLSMEVLPSIYGSAGASEASLYRRLQSLKLSIRPDKLVQLLNAFDCIVKHRALDKDPIVWSSLCNTSQWYSMARTAPKTFTEFGHFVHEIMKSKGKLPQIVQWIGGHSVNWKQTLESYFAAEAFAEVGEQETARNLSQTAMPNPKESIGIMSALSKTFAAAAFAEENCHDMATEILAGTTRKGSFLEEVGLLGVRVRYGLVSAERSFADIVGLTGVRYRVLTLQL